MRTKAQKTHLVIRRECSVPMENSHTYMIPSAIAELMGGRK